MSPTPTGNTLRPVMLISAIDGWSIVIVAGVGTVISLVLVSWIGVLVGALITFAGIIELRGRARLKRDDRSGITLLIAAQLLILVTVVVYSAANLLCYDEAALLAQLAAHMPQLEQALARAGVPPSEVDIRAMLKPVYFTLYLVVIAVTVLFQGGLALFYRSYRGKIVPPLP